MGLDTEYLDGRTPLEEEEKEGLRVKSIATRGELDEFEQQNIEQAIQWTLGISTDWETVYSEDFIKMVHKRMFSNVWTWAGKFRNTSNNLGIEPWLIPGELKYLLDDVRYWHQHSTYPPDEIALRFKHRLVSIHCFPNGNGRHSRLMADIIVDKIYKKPIFTWGAAGFTNADDSRAMYLKALNAADREDYQELLIFGRA
jgi:Fic-DOC domain mobile mystery protein B